MKRLSRLAGLLLAVSASAQSVEMRRLDIRGLPVLDLEVRVRDEKGQEMGGLSAGAFDVRLDGVTVAGVRVEPAGALPGKTPPPVFLLVDRSGDLSASAGHALRKAAALLVDSLPTGTPIAVHSFDARLKEEIGLEADRERIKKAIVNIAPGQGTSYVEPLQSVVQQAAATDPARAVVLFLVHAQHYPTAPPAAGRAYSLPGHTTPIYPVVLEEGSDAGVSDLVAKVVRRLVQGLPGIYRLAIPAPFSADGDMHTLAVGLAAGHADARCRFRAMRGPATSPSSVLDAELRRRNLVPLQGALVGALLGAIAVLVLGAQSGPIRFTPLMRLGLVGVSSVAGAILFLAAFPSL